MKLRSYSKVPAINAFFYSNKFILLIAALTVLSNVFCAELFVYTVYILIGMYIVLCCPDFLPLMPMFAFGYITPSMGNNPGQNPESIFYPGHGGVYLITMLLLLAAALVFRLLYDRPLWRQMVNTERKLLPGMVMLCGAYLLSGIGSKEYFDIFFQNLVFSSLQCVAVAGLYLFFTGGVHWEKVQRGYFARIAMAMGVVLFIEVANIYFSGMILEGGVIDRENIATGWGMYNNIGAMLAMMVPFPFYFACRSHKYGGLYNIVGALLVCGVILTCSRASILCAVGIYFLSMFGVLKKANNRRSNQIAYGITAGIAVLTAVVLKDELMQIFQMLVEKGFDPSSRDRIYRDGLRQYAKYPVFGGSFFPKFYLWDWSSVENFSSFFPPRWHNTIVQLVASCGSVGLVGYAIHRIQTVKLFLEPGNRVVFKAFIGLSLLVLLGTSLLDCHFFNVGPVLYYSIALAFVEKCNGRKHLK